MDKDIEQRLRRVYPTGNVDVPDVDALFADDYVANVAQVIASVCSTHRMHVDSDMHAPTDCTRGFAITEQDGPRKVDWCGLFQRHGNPEKLQWIAQHKRPFPILWLKVSRVFPVYRFYYNLWTPRGDTGYLDIVIDYSPPTPDWVRLHPDLHAALHTAGLRLMDEDAAKETVPFMFEEVFVDHGDDWDAEPSSHPVAINVHHALFPNF